MSNLKIIDPNTATTEEITKLINFVSQVSLGEDVDLELFVEPLTEYQKGWNDAIKESNKLYGKALSENKLDVDGQSGIVYTKKE